MLSDTQVEEVYRAHYPDLLAYAERKRVANYEDIVQEAFISLSRCKEEILSIRNYLYRAVTLGVLQERRDRDRRARFLPKLAKTEAVSDQPELVLIERDYIQTALNRLSQDERAAVKALYLDGLSFAEASKRLKKSVPTIQSQRDRAKKKLLAARA